MKNRLLRLLPLLALLIALLPSCASAVTGRELSALRGERSYPQALELPAVDALQVSSRTMRLSAGEENAYPTPDPERIAELTAYYRSQLTDLGAALDFLTLFSEDFVGALVSRANSLQSMFLLVEDKLSRSDREQLTSFIEDYSLIASNLYSEIEFLTTKLAFGYNRIDALVTMIQSGECSPSETDGYLSELSALYEEASERLNSFTNDDKHLYQYLMDFYTAELMIEAMDVYVCAVYDKAEAIISDEADRLAAQENGSGLLRASSTRVRVISKSQYVISVTDENSAPIPDAQVSIRVLNSSGKVTKTLPAMTTDGKGYAIFWFSDFGPDSKGEADIDVVVRADGYRTQATGKLSVQGGSFMPLTLAPDTGTPYLIQSTYNNQDIVRVANGIYTSPYNDAQQTLSFTVNTSVPCRVELYQPGTTVENVIASFDLDPSSPGSAMQDAAHPTEFTRSFTAQYSSDRYFLPKQPVYVRILQANAQANEQPEVTETLFSIKKARVSKPVSLYNSNILMGNVGFNLPADWPILGNMRLQIPLGYKKVRFTFYVELDGTTYVGASYVIDDFPKNWKSQSAKDIDKNAKDLAASGASQLEQIMYGIVDDYSQMCKDKFIGSSTMSITPYIMGIFRPVSEDGDLEKGWNSYLGDFSMGALFSYKFSASYYPIPFVPLYLGIDFSMGTHLALTCGISFDMYKTLGGFRNVTYRGDLGITFSPYVEVIASLGLGVPRFFYVALRGKAYATTDIVLVPNPHIKSWKVSAIAYIEASALFWKYQAQIWGVSKEWVNPGDTIMSRLLIDSMQESFAAESGSQDFMAVSKSRGVQDYTTLENVVPTSTMYVTPKNNNTRFFSVSMGFCGKPDTIPDMGLCMWLEDDASGSTRICYRSTSLNSVNDMNPPYAKTYQLDSTPEGYSVVDYDVDYKCLSKFYMPYICVAQTVVPTGTPQERVAEESFVILSLHVVDNDWLPRQNSRIRVASIKLNLRQSWTLTTKGVIMPRVRFIQGKSYDFVAGALSVNSGSANTSCTILTWDSASSGSGWDASKAQTFSQGDYEPAEFFLLDSRVQAAYSNALPGYILLLRSRSNAEKSMLLFGPVCTFMPLIQQKTLMRIGGGSMNFSSIQLVEEYDSLYNHRQLGIAALRIVNDSETGLVQSRLMLMQLTHRDNNNPESIWNSLNPVDTGVLVGADGLGIMEINGTHYAYWLTSRVGEDGKKSYNLNASYIDCKNGLASQPFGLLTLASGLSQDSADSISGIRLLPLKEGSSTLYGLYLNYSGAEGHYRIGKFTYGLQIGLEVTSLAADYPIIVPGDTFTSYIALRNTGMMPIYNFSIDYLTQPADQPGARSTFVTQIYVDMMNLNNNALRDENGNTRKQGEAVVYRQDDGSMETNGETIHLTRYSTSIWAQTAEGNITGGTREDRTLSALPADGVLHLKTAFTAPLNCWGNGGDVTLTARVHNLESGTDLQQVNPVTSFSGSSDAAVATAAAPMLTALSDDAPQEDADSFEKVTLQTVYYANLDQDGRATDEKAFDLAGNDMKLEANVVLAGGIPTAQITLSNLSGPQADGVIPMLVAMVNGKETYRLALKTELNSSHTRSLSVPLSELAGGEPYSAIDLYLVERTSANQLTQDSLDYASYDEVNRYDNHAVLSAVTDFYFTAEPQSTSAFVGQDVTFAAEVAGASGPFTCQWFEVNTDGTKRTLRGETGTTLTLPKVTLAQNGTQYACTFTNSHNVQLTSSTATLTVSEELPVTGDTLHPSLWLALLCASSLPLALLLATRRRRSAGHSHAPRDGEDC